MVSILLFANDNILSCHFFLFLIIDLYFLIPAVITQAFNPIAELIIFIGIPIKETKTEMEKHPVTVKTNINMIILYLISNII